MASAAAAPLSEGCGDGARLSRLLALLLILVIDHWSVLAAPPALGCVRWLACLARLCCLVLFLPLFWCLPGDACVRSISASTDGTAPLARPLRRRSAHRPGRHVDRLRFHRRRIISVQALRPLFLFFLLGVAPALLNYFKSINITAIQA